MSHWVTDRYIMSRCCGRNWHPLCGAHSKHCFSLCWGYSRGYVQHSRCCFFSIVKGLWVRFVRVFPFLQVMEYEKKTIPCLRHIMEDGDLIWPSLSLALCNICNKSGLLIQSNRTAATWYLYDHHVHDWGWQQSESSPTKFNHPFSYATVTIFTWLYYIL